MRAGDIMTEGPICVDQGASIFDAAESMLAAGVSALPVVDSRGRVVGIISEADLMRRGEIGTTARESWLSLLVADKDTAAHEFVQAHSRCISEVMTTPVITAGEETELPALVELMEKHGVKRLPIVRGDIVVGIVSRANILQALLSREPAVEPGHPSDKELRRAVEMALERQGWKSSWPINVVANAGVVHLWGFVPSAEVRRACRVAAETVPGVRSVESHLRPLPASVGMGV